MSKTHKTLGVTGTNFVIPTSENGKLSGNQTISGVKTFSDNIVVNTINGFTLKNSVSGPFESCIPIIKSDGVLEIGKYIDMLENASTKDYDARFTLNSDNVSLNTKFIASNINPVNSILTMYGTENPSTKCKGTWVMVDFDGELVYEINNHEIRLDMNNRMLHCTVMCYNTRYGAVNITYPASDFGLFWLSNYVSYLPISVFVNNVAASGHTITFIDNNDNSTSVTIDIRYGSNSKPDYVATFEKKLFNAVLPEATLSEIQMVYNLIVSKNGTINSTTWRRTALK
jgi:hypothetical protein